MRKMNVIMPVKDAMEMAREAIVKVMEALKAEGESPARFTVYDDNSSPAAAGELRRLSQQWGFGLVALADLTTSPSPNYRTTLQHAQRGAIEEEADLVIVESDVMLRSHTLSLMQQQAGAGVGMVAAVTVDDAGIINFPYEYARKLTGGTVETTKRFSFCCTLLTQPFLQAYSFAALDPSKSWYDVFISHKSVELGFRNLLMLDNSVLHKPHASRPWKLLKYTHPLRYYFQKIIHRRDRI